MTSEANDLEAINRIPPNELLYLKRLFHLQSLSEDAVILDHLPYTTQIKGLVAEMTKKFPDSLWTEKYVSRTLIRLSRLESNPSED